MSVRKSIAMIALALLAVLGTMIDPTTDEANAVGITTLPVKPLFMKSLTIPNLDQARESARKAKLKQASKPAGKTRHFEVTAYSLGDGFTPTHGITASGERVKEGKTLACPKSLPFGTKVFIPALNHTYTCTDRGGMIKEGHLDIYIKSIKKALQFGRRQMKTVLIEA